MFLSRFRKFCHPSKQLSIRLCGTAFEPKINNPPAFVDNGKMYSINYLKTKSGITEVNEPIVD